MEKNYIDIENTTIAEYKVALHNVEQKIVEALKEKNHQKVRMYTKIYFRLNKLLNQKNSCSRKKNNTKSR